MPTLTELIDQYEAANPRPRHVGAGRVTPLGLATVAACRLLRQMRALDPEDRVRLAAFLVSKLPGRTEALADQPPGP